MAKKRSAVLTANRSYNAARAQELAEEIMRHKLLYYAGKPEVSDAAYDALENELRLLSPNHPALVDVGTSQVAIEKKVAHDRPMLSLQKTYDLGELNRWAEKDDVVGTLKIDGNSLSLVYENGALTLAKTRGNGRFGEEVTSKARWVADVVPQLESKTKVEIRGELYCTIAQFTHLTEVMAQRGLERPTSPRNIVAGFLGRKSHVELSRFFNFLAFDAIFEDGQAPFHTEVEKFEWLAKQGFQLPEHKFIDSPKKMQEFLDRVREVIGEDDLGVDGAVFTYNNLASHGDLGATAHHPRYKMSFKWQGETATSTVEKIEWATSRLGIVTPVAVIDPVFLSGAKITNITLHNAAHVTAFNIKAGDTIEIVRSGEVIPKYLRTTQSGSGNAVLLTECPSCQTTLEFDDVRLKCPNQTGCPAQQIGVILNWIRCAEIEDLSEKRLFPLLDLDLVNTAGDLYRLTLEDFYRIPNTKEKMATKLHKNIQSSKKLPLAQFLNGLGIEGAGLTTWEKLLESYPTLKAIQKAKAEDIQQLNGFAERSAEQIVKGLVGKKAMIDDLLEAGVKPQNPTPVSQGDSTGPLLGKAIVITGTLSQPRSAIEKMIKDAGGKTSSSVSQNTFAVVTGDPSSNSSKMQKARKLGVLTWSEEDLAAAVGPS
jgi:DNA ligase (NAD+)